jgi:hypothetical protein
MHRFASAAAALVVSTCPMGVWAEGTEAAPTAATATPIATPTATATATPVATATATAASVPAADAFSVRATGFLRASYDWVQKDPNVDFVGRNDGFWLRNARVGIEGTRGENALSFALSVEAAQAMSAGPNTPQGTIQPALRDAYIRYELTPWLGVQVGQSLAPFDAENLRDTKDLAFASRAVGQEGTYAAFAYDEPGLTYDRFLGVTLSSRAPIRIGDFGVGYALMAANGNGPNQLFNDNNSLALFGRLELWYRDRVRVGVAALYNPRTVGALPNLYEEDDTGFAGDLLVRFRGLEVAGQMVQLHTSYPTVGSPDRTRVAWHAQAFYRVETPWFDVAPAYRYAVYVPWSGDVTTNTSGVDLSAFTLHYHTVGVRFWHKTQPLQLLVNYTFTGEESTRALHNDRLEVVTQVTF